MLVAVQSQQWLSRSGASGGGLPLKELWSPCWACEGASSCSQLSSQCLYSLTVVSSSTAGQWQMGRVGQPHLSRSSFWKEDISIGLLKQVGSPGATTISEHRLCHWATWASSFPHGTSARSLWSVAEKGTILRLSFHGHTKRPGESAEERGRADCVRGPTDRGLETWHMSSVWFHTKNQPDADMLCMHTYASHLDPLASFGWQKYLRAINFLTRSLRYMMGEPNLWILLLTKLSDIKRSHQQWARTS